MMNKASPIRNPIVNSDLEYIISLGNIPWNKLAGKTVLVTGAAGFLAAYIVETLLFLNEKRKLDITVIGIARNEDRFNWRFAHYLERQELHCIVQDITSPLKIDQPVDFIIHAASQASPKYYATDPVGTLSANTLGTAQLLDLAYHMQIESFLYFSSAEVYGQAGKIPTAETDYGTLDPLAVRSCYAESKRMGENMCVAWHSQFNVPAKIVRPFHTYGPGMQLDDGRVYADFVADAVHSRNITMKSDGLSRRAFCYIADATAGFFTVLLSGVNSQAYNIGNPDCEISIRDLAYLIADIPSEKKISVESMERAHTDAYLTSSVQVTCPDVSKAKSLGWTPTTSLDQGFRKTIESYSY